jgi:hypothetical protein
MAGSMTFRVGDWVEVLSKDEILATLDRDGRLDGMPFMPEMFAYCGRRFRVQQRAHKTCDTVFPIRSRRVTEAVHLETRCNGEAHGGCQAGCLIFWKHAWLKPVDGPAGTTTIPLRPRVASQPAGAGCSEGDVHRAAGSSEVGDVPDPVYVCQATRLPYASEDLSPYDFRQYLEDYTSGNVGAGRWLRGMIYITYQNLIDLGIGLGVPLRWLYEHFQALWGGLPYPQRPGRLANGDRTPTAHLNLQAGEWVRVKSYEEIMASCTENRKNRGMGFDGEMMPYCGGTYQVLKRVTRIVNEKTGRMQHMQNPCIILNNVVCEGRYSNCRMFCPRAIYPYWREIWLERVERPSA